MTQLIRCEQTAILYYPDGLLSHSQVYCIIQMDWLSHRQVCTEVTQSHLFTFGLIKYYIICLENILEQAENKILSKLQCEWRRNLHALASVNFWKSYQIVFFIKNQIPSITVFTAFLLLWNTYYNYITKYQSVLLTIVDWSTSEWTNVKHIEYQKYKLTQLNMQ